VRHFKPGDRVLRAYALYPDEVVGSLHSGWGGFAEFGRISDWQAMGYPPGSLRYQQLAPRDLPAAHATMLIPIKEIWSSVNRVEPIAGRRFLVTGAGITGVLFGRFLLHRGAAAVILAARRPEALERAARLGAASEVMLLNDAPTLLNCNALVDTTGSLSTMYALSQALQPGATVYGYAVYADDPADERWATLRREHAYQRIDPVEWSAADAADELLRKGVIRPADLVSHVDPLESFERGWNRVIRRETFKSVIQF
jgi:threonine dehydrogenase-like Zn-dependent dehydrogenase